MRVVISLVSQFASGIFDSLQFPITLFCIYGSTTLSKEITRILTYSFFIFSTMQLVFLFVILPILNVFVNYFTINDHIVNVSYYLFWMYPAHALALTINNSSLDTLSKRSMEIFIGKTPKPTSKYPNINKCCFRLDSKTL